MEPIENKNDNSDLPEEYVQGFAIFSGIKIDLSCRVLIPRPETEFWVTKAVDDLLNLKRRNLRILDIFSGSGCVGIAVAKSLPDARVDFGDIDPRSITQIKINIAANQIPQGFTNVYKSDIFNDIPPCLYDAILANPPYIDPARIAEVQDSVLDHEPHGALFSANGGLRIIEDFLKQAIKFLKPGGFIYLEFDALQMGAIEDLAEIGGYMSISFFKDQYGEWRFAKISK